MSLKGTREVLIQQNYGVVRYHTNTEAALLEAQRQLEGKRALATRAQTGEVELHENFNLDGQIQYLEDEIRRLTETLPQK